MFFSRLFSSSLQVTSTKKKYHMLHYQYMILSLTMMTPTTPSNLNFNLIGSNVILYIPSPHEEKIEILSQK